MRKLLLLVSVVLISSCSSAPFEHTKNIYDAKYLKPDSETSHVRVHRVSQVSGSALGESCPLVLKVDNTETVGLQQNQYVDLYLPNGNHTLSVRFKCALTAWKKSVDLLANGNYQEYATETGAVGQYRMWRVK